MAVVAGCIQITISTDTSFNSQVRVALGQLGGECAGTSTATQGTETATVTQTLQDDSTCKVEVAFTSTLIKMADLRAKVEQSIRDQGRDPSKVGMTITSPCTITLSNLGVTGVTLPTTAWSAELSLQGDALATLQGDDVATMGAEPIKITLSDANIAALNAAYASETDVQVQGVVTLASVSLQAMGDMPVQAQATLSFDALSEVQADATLDLF
jgi:hypothetical protein